MNEKVLIVGSGGREHSLAEYISRSPEVKKIYCAPGNGGTQQVAENINIGPTDASAIAAFCVKEEVGLVVVSTDDSLEAGVVDAVEASGCLAFGPTRTAARLEWDKIWAYTFATEHNIPVPDARPFDDLFEAFEYIKSQEPQRIVIKANGLAGGKGVYLPKSLDDAASELLDVMYYKKLGAAGDQVLIQERLIGKEVSVLAICNGETYKLLPVCQDYKRRNDSDLGPNTGGMGAVAPVDILSEQQILDVEQKILQPTLRGMIENCTPFKGMLYLGLIVTDEGPKLIEYNVRPGDPEIQTILPLLDQDMYKLLKNAALDEIPTINLRPNFYSALVAISSSRYPQSKAKGEEIYGLDAVFSDVEIFHAGTEFNGVYKAVGGRILNIVGLGESLDEALRRAYSVISNGLIGFDNMHYRTDIGSNI
jgi:phosphoribosylamine--glycine ligase